ncbi:MAG: LytR C-terminal domain-containing protein [Gordonia sp. (in: high G+C Gram-positive bacteria)]|uniref:LytR C-terminal domain-containing protein n=1 Tax=Gordonia sp. (in: high G+C Gram-positive bacteria) TaxID=84139 RepID=UPI0039E4DE0A
MKADRDSNRLPYRAGAMVLLAVAVVFIGLGWHSAATTGDESAKNKLEHAGQSAPASVPASSTAESKTSAATKTSTTSSKRSGTSTTRADAATGATPKICVLNIGVIRGLAQEVSDHLKAEGFKIGTKPANYITSSVTENTVFYGSGQESAAEKVAASVPGGAVVEERPSAFTRCPGELAVVVTSR